MERAIKRVFDRATPIANLQDWREGCGQNCMVAVFTLGVRLKVADALNQA